MELIRQIKPKGIVVIPVDIRKQVDLQEGDSISFKTEGKKIIIEKKKKNSNDALERFFTISRRKGSRITLKEIREIEDESYDLP